MNQPPDNAIAWHLGEVGSPELAEPVPAVCATGLPYRDGANRLQTLNLYLPATAATRVLVGTPVRALPGLIASGAPSCLVHIHGGAWRSPEVTATSIEPTVAHAFASEDRPIEVIASVDYSISPFPDAPEDAYDPVKDRHRDTAREAVHPQHLDDVLHAFALLRSLGLADESYVLSGHSCGACLAFQAVLAEPGRYGLEIAGPPFPAAVLGVNGLYDLPALVHDLGPKHAHLAGEYRKLLSLAFGADERVWTSASPARLGAATLRRDGLRAVLLEQSPDDKLVPMNQRAMLATMLTGAQDLNVVLGDRCSGNHAAPWERGGMLWQCVRDTLALCRRHTTIRQQST